MNMKKQKISLQVLFLALICCTLCACQTDKALSQTTQPQKSPQQLLEEQPIDDTHDAFLVDTGGELGILLVTAELDEKTSTEVCRATIQFTIWNPYSMSEPIQTLTAGTDIFLDRSIIDANFDGYMDFTCTYLRGNQPHYEHLWIWNEEHGLFEEVPEYDKISMPTLDEETEIIYGFNRNSAGGTGEHTFYQWIGGNLLCVRKIEIYRIDQSGTVRMSIQDYVTDKLVEIYHEDFPPQSYGWQDAQMVWHNLDYHGEVE